MMIQILCDNPASWMVPYVKDWVKDWADEGYDITLLFNSEEIAKGDILIMLSCERIFKKLELNKCNLVVHESALPKGKGWSPLTWQVLEGEKKIPVTLFEAAEQVDAGAVYEQVFIELNGHELINELREKQAEATRQLITAFLKKYPHVTAYAQTGESSYYPRRKAADSELDINKTIHEQFNLLRVCDNERYPAYFIKEGIKYMIKIYKENE